MNYITIFVAFGISFFLTAGSGPIIIPFLKRLKFGQSIREDGPTWHKGKQGTPTMGGLMFILGIFVAVACAAVPLIMKNRDYRMLVLLIMPLLYALIGFADDYMKRIKKRNLGLNVRQKSMLQTIVAAAFLAAMYLTGSTSTEIIIPFFNIRWDLGAFYYLLSAIVIVGFVNAVNLTDGVDGLAASVTLIVSLFYLAASVVLCIETVGIFAAAVAGGMIGFLLFNFHPAKVFMGDTGSLFLGGAVCSMAFALNIPLIIFLAGFIYLMEAVSVMLQVAYFKITKGKRLFKMSPIHHHFEMSGWSEVKIVTAFSAVTAVLCAAAFVSVIMLKASL